MRYATCIHMYSPLVVIIADYFILEGDKEPREPDGHHEQGYKEEETPPNGEPKSILDEHEKVGPFTFTYIYIPE